MKTILVVDDDANTVAIIRAELERVGYDVVTADTGAAAITTLAEGCADALVLGELAPPFDWFELAKWLRSNSSTQYILILLMKSQTTDPISEEFLFRTFAVSIDHMLWKPIHSLELIALLRFFLRAREQTTE